MASEQSIPFQVEEIDHVELFVPDRQVAAEWYRRTLGLCVLPEFESWSEPQGGPLIISSDGGRTKLALFVGKPQGDLPSAGYDRVAFRVGRSGLAKFLAHIKSHPVYDDRGKEVKELTIVDHGKAHSVYFRDPYGNRLEVTTYEV